MNEACFKDSSKMYLNPIIDWSESDVWDFHRQEKIPYCKLYDEGFKRIGCLFCPMAGKQRAVEVIKYPNFERKFREAFQLLYEDKIRKGLKSVNRWKDGSDMFDWWLCENREKVTPDQSVMFE